MSQYALVSKQYQQNERRSNLSLQRSAITQETIKQRQDLQKSVLKHTNRLIHQLLKNLTEADNVIKKNLSRGHLQRLVNYLRNDIEPLPGFISRISLHAENLGSMKKEYELQKAFNESVQNVSFSTITSESNSSFTRYMLDKAARSPTPIIPEKKLETPRTPYYTPRCSNQEKLSAETPKIDLIKLAEPVYSTANKKDTPARSRPHGGYISKCTSPIHFAQGDTSPLDKKDSAEQVNLPLLDPEDFDMTQLLRTAQSGIAVASGIFLKLMLRKILLWKFRITGSRKLGKKDMLLLMFIITLVYQCFSHLLEHGWRVYRSATGIRRGIKAM